ncbi:MAG: hypothetical protein J6S64_01125 [Bacteroidales bacterium]|nr:hypothetical protein [Bacteroidales bacterium]
MLKAEYIIDGVKMDVTPEDMLRSASGLRQSSEKAGATIIDESTDTAPAAAPFDKSGIKTYLDAVAAAKETDIPLAYSASRTRMEICRKLIDTIWQKGHFRLEDLSVNLRWKWAEAPIGSMAALYSSVEAACDLIDGLGIMADKYSCTPGDSRKLEVSASLNEDDADDELRDSASPSLSPKRKTPEALEPDPGDWLIYVPFDTGHYRLGGSLLSEAAGNPGGQAPEEIDPDYFFDCYEVVRELVEDGIVVAGATVGRGGLMAALGRMTRDCGAAISIDGIMESSGDEKVNVLFGEVPGVVFAIKDLDYDYIDAELLLQDVAYYPLGHPKAGTGVTLTKSDGIMGILQSLMDASEGED